MTDTQTTTPKMTSPKTCTYIYAAFALSMPVILTGIYGMLLGSILMIGAVIAAYAQQDAASGTVYDSHIRWLIRTFWIGNLVYAPLAGIIGYIYIQMHMDMNVLVQAAQNGAAPTADNVMKIMFQHYGGLWKNTMYVTSGAFSLWWLLRCLSGYLVLRRNKSIANPGSWF